MSTLSQYLGEHGTQKDSISKNGMSLNNKKMNGRYRTNGRGFCRWCFLASVWRQILRGSEISQDPVLKTKEADVADLRREYNPGYGKEGLMIQPVRLNSTEGL